MEATEYRRRHSAVTDNVMSISAQMTAVLARAAGGPEVLQLVTQDVPTPGPGEVLIRVQAAGVNRADVLQRHGNYPVRTGANPVLGLEVAGEIVQLGAGVDGWRVGERVCTLTDGGGYAEYALAPAVQLLRWPQNYDALLAAALPESCFTVWANLFQAGRLQAREFVLIHGGRGGVGSMAIQLARAFDAQVLATSGSASGCRDCIALGAERAINYRSEDLAATVMAATDGHGADVILDPVGAQNLNFNLDALAMDGRLVIIGFTGGSVAREVPLTRILTQRLVITGSAMRPRSAVDKAAIAAALLAKVWPLLDRGACRPPIARVFPLAEATEAHRLMETGGYLGKIVLTTSA